jgi:hypothetical protein
MYGEMKDEKVRGGIATMIGAQIFYVGCPLENFKKISLEAKATMETLQASGLTKSKALERLTKEHQTPRKIGGMKLIEYMAQHDATQDEFESMLQTFLSWNYVTRQENNDLKPFQKVNVFTTPEASYHAAGIELIDF